MKLSQSEQYQYHVDGGSGSLQMVSKTRTPLLPTGESGGGGECEIPNKERRIRRGKGGELRLTS